MQGLVNNYYILNAINDITTQTKQLKNNEAFYYKSKIGNAKINNKSYVNMPKILKELGSQTIEQERVEVLKIKTKNASESENKRLKITTKAIS